MVRRPFIIMCVALAACAPADKNPAPRDGSATQAPAQDVAEDPVAAGECRKTGDWQLCSVEDRLTRAGFVIEKLEESPSYAFFSVPGTAFRVGAGSDRVEVFIYASAAARQADTEKMDSAAVSPKGERVNYPVPALLITSRNLAAIAFTYNERQKERIDLALSAGLPAR